MFLAAFLSVLLVARFAALTRFRPALDAADKSFPALYLSVFGFRRAIIFSSLVD